MTEKYVDPGHRLSDEDWAKVQARAAEVRAELLVNLPGGASGPGGIVVDMTAAGVRSKKYFGVSGLATQLLVLHSAECPLRAGYAVSLSEWFQATVHPAAPTASWQRFVDPVHRVRALPDELGAWHASEANPLSIGWEQAGYARFSRAEWTTPDGLAQLELLAFDMAEVAVRDGIPARWLSDWEVRQVLDHGNRQIKGFCLHRQIDPETRTDPGGGYPYDLLMSRIAAYMGGATIPTPEETKEWYQMALDEQTKKDINQAVWGGPGMPLVHNYRLGRGEYAGTILGSLEGRFQNEILGPVASNLVGAIKAVSSGEDFDEAKLLEGIKTTVEAAVAASPVTTVELDAEDVASLAEQLKSTLAPGLAAELAKRLAE